MSSKLDVCTCLANIILSSYSASLSRAICPPGRAFVSHARGRGGSISPTSTLVSRKSGESGSEQLRFAFDGDAVLFSDEAERVYKQEGLEAFTASEKAAAREPLAGGPFKPFLSALHSLQQAFPPTEAPIRTALVTARSAPAHERVIRTLRAWNIRIDESIFLGGLNKTEFLRAYQADVFFDDQEIHCDSASPHIATGHVPHGVANS